MAYSRAVTRVGEAGSGQLAKMVNQVAIAGLVQGLAEALAFGQRAGLDMPLVLDVIGKGAAQSWPRRFRACRRWCACWSCSPNSNSPNWAAPPNPQHQPRPPGKPGPLFLEASNQAGGVPAPATLGL